MLHLLIYLSGKGTGSPLRQLVCRFFISGAVNSGKLRTGRKWANGPRNPRYFGNPILEKSSRLDVLLARGQRQGKGPPSAPHPQFPSNFGFGEMFSISCGPMDGFFWLVQPLFFLFIGPRRQSNLSLVKSQSPASHLEYWPI
jgi:hypothetical protein